LNSEEGRGVISYAKENFGPGGNIAIDYPYYWGSNYMQALPSRRKF
jgi:hypothetical protein